MSSNFIAFNANRKFCYLQQFFRLGMVRLAVLMLHKCLK